MRYSSAAIHVNHANRADDDDGAGEWDLVFANATGCSGSTHFAPYYVWSTSLTMNGGPRWMMWNRHDVPGGDGHGMWMVNDAGHAHAQHRLALVVICGAGVAVVDLNDLQWPAAHWMADSVLAPAIAWMDER